ncbi:hypothetical protein [Pseudochryseolinea flava]|uniref:Uncharacterized protein n=1 Tax=Pseudochryseolinea flava TaxID=2059302 RepID=A0A364XWK5_9BACT|nr:hypothetical protein [Pseudochryseolinea flava]RAV98592.1 hypothetical protein DQQ10_22925 [Pseudochryseolinea flava]
MQVKGNVILYNTRIYEEENLQPDVFLEKVKLVQRIRTSRQLKFSFLPTSAKDLERNNKIWEFVNGNSNALNYDHKYFIIMLPDWLHQFLRFSTQKNVMECIVVALTGLYAGEPAMRAKLEKRLERSLYLRVTDYYRQYFSDFEDFSFIVAEDWNLTDQINDEYFQKRKRFISRFDYFFRDHCSNPIVIPHIYPVYDPRYEQSMFVKNTFDVPLVNSYFSKSDWKRIILGDSKDELIRMESEAEPWIKWKESFVRENRLRA